MNDESLFLKESWLFTMRGILLIRNNEAFWFSLVVLLHSEHNFNSFFTYG